MAKNKSINKLFAIFLKSARNAKNMSSYLPLESNTSIGYFDLKSARKFDSIQYFFFGIAVLIGAFVYLVYSVETFLILRGIIFALLLVVSCAFLFIAIKICLYAQRRKQTKEKQRKYKKG